MRPGAIFESRCSCTEFLVPLVMTDSTDPADDRDHLHIDTPNDSKVNDTDAVRRCLPSMPRTRSDDTLAQSNANTRRFTAEGDYEFLFTVDLIAF